MAAVWLGPSIPAAVLEDKEGRTKAMQAHSLVLHWLDDPGVAEVLILIDEEPDALIANRCKRRGRRETLAWKGGPLHLGFLPYSSGGKFPPHPPTVELADLPPGEYAISIHPTGWTQADETRLTKVLVGECGRTRWRIYNGVEGAGCIVVLLGLIVLAGLVVAAFQEGMWASLAIPMLVVAAVMALGPLATRWAKRIPYLRRVDELSEELGGRPEWSFPEVAFVVRSCREGIAGRPSLVRKFAGALDGMRGPRTDAGLADWLEERWARFETTGPFPCAPIRTGFVEMAWEENEQSIYCAMYPISIASNLVDFEVYSFYSSSVQQDVIRHRVNDASSFVPTERGEGVEGILRFLNESAVLEGHESVISNLEGLGLPPDLHWLKDLRFTAAIASREPDVLEWVASSESGYLILFAVDG